MKYPLFKVHVDVPAAIAELTKVLSSGFINEGVQVTQLTKEMSTFLETDKLTLVNSCTSALTLALKLAGVKYLDNVITTPMTCVATNTPISTNDASITWADINPKTGCIDPTAIEKAICANSARAVMAVAWAGNPPDLDQIKSICDRHGMKLILDAAHALGAKYKGRPVHEFAHYTCYSFQAIKHVTTGDGGAIVCNDQKDFDRVKKLKWFGIDRDHAKDDKGNWKGQSWDFDIKEAGYKFNMNNLSAAIGLSQIPHIKNVIDSHVKNAKLYDELLKNNQFIEPLHRYDGAESTHWVYTVLLKNANINKDTLLKSLNETHEIGAGLVHIPNHWYECFSSSWHTSQFDGVSEFQQKQFSIPCGWWLTDHDIKHIVDCINVICKDLLS